MTGLDHLQVLTPEEVRELPRLVTIGYIDPEHPDREIVRTVLPVGLRFGPDPPRYPDAEWLLEVAEASDTALWGRTIALRDVRSWR